jgi:hypothetical protein
VLPGVTLDVIGAARPGASGCYRRAHHGYFVTHHQQRSSGPAPVAAPPRGEAAARRWAGVHRPEVGHRPIKREVHRPQPGCRGTSLGAVGDLGPRDDAVANQLVDLDELPTTFVSLTRDGTLYVGSFKDKVSRMYRAAPSGSTFGLPEAIELPSDTPTRYGNPLIAPDGSFLVVSARSEQPGAEPDLYVTRPLAGGGWTRPRTLGSGLNTPYTEFAPGLSPDGRYLFFTSERPGIAAAPPAGSARAPGDLYQIDLAALPVAEPSAP